MSKADINWIVSCPCNDGNFKIHLKSATADELKEALSKMPEYHNQTKIKAIKAELRRRTRQCLKN